jgi:hypothetical protein
VILIVAPRTDAHARCVAQDLEKMGRPFRIVDSSRLSEDGRIEFRAGQHRGSVWTCVDGRPVPLEAVETVWHRRRFLPRPTVRCDVDDHNYFRREWTEMISGVLASLDAWFVNDPGRQDAAVKPLQLRIAEKVGLRIPDTLITNDPAAAAAFIERHRQRVVHKTISPPKHRFLPTKQWSESDREMLKDLVLGPTIFQEMVTDCRELRITVIGDRVFAAEFRPGVGIIDGRCVDDTPYRPHSLPDEVSRGLLDLVRTLGLVFSTIDMKLTDEGEYVFLELNPMGQYLYTEILAGLPLTATMAELLAAGRASQSKPAPSVSDQRGGTTARADGVRWRTDLTISNMTAAAASRCGS